MTELQSAYESVFGRELDKRNFRKKFAQLDLVKETDEYKREGAHRPAQLHMFKSTTVEDVVNGYNLAKEVSDDTGLPIIYNVCLKSLVDDLPEEIRANAFPIELYMREEWML